MSQTTVQHYADPEVTEALAQCVPLLRRVVVGQKRSGETIAVLRLLYPLADRLPGRVKELAGQLVKERNRWMMKDRSDSGFRSIVMPACRTLLEAMIVSAKGWHRGEGGIYRRREGVDYFLQVNPPALVSDISRVWFIYRPPAQSETWGVHGYAVLSGVYVHIDDTAPSAIAGACEAADDALATYLDGLKAERKTA